MLNASPRATTFVIALLTVKVEYDASYPLCNMKNIKSENRAQSGIIVLILILILTPLYYKLFVAEIAKVNCFMNN